MLVKRQNQSGFTLVELLVVIAIIAVLVSVVIPVVGESSRRASAATDAANLRSTLISLNTEILLNDTVAEEYIASFEPVQSKLHPEAKLHVVYWLPGIIDVYYVDGSNYYGLEYLSDIAAKGSTTLQPTAAALADGAIWYEVGVGKVS